MPSVDPTKLPFKTRFTVQAHLYKPTNETEQQEVKASLNGLKGLLPPDIDPEKDPAIVYIVGNLAVAGLVNLNDDALSIEDGLRVYKGFERQQCNIEHNRGTIVGFIIKAGLSEFGTDRLITEDEARTANKPFNIVTVAAIWKVADKDLAEFLQSMGAPGSPDKDKLSYSFEVGFDDYSVVVLPKGSDNLAEASMTIASDTREFSRFDKLLRAHGGTGKFGKDGRVGRVLSGNIVPLGQGIVTVPAAAVKGLAPITTSPHAAPDGEVDASGTYNHSSTQVTLSEEDAAPFMAYAMAIKDEHLYLGEKYPYGSKCPHCGSPTITTQRMTSDEAMESCAKGHEYHRKEAVKVESDSYGPDYGRELSSHITCLYGIEGTDHTAIHKAVAGYGSIVAELGEVSAFINDDKNYDVVKVDVHSQDLHNIHNLIKGAAKVQEFEFPYFPHLTLGYTKKGMSKHYIGDKRFAGQKLIFHSISFRPHSGGEPVDILTHSDKQPLIDSVYNDNTNADDIMASTPTRYIKLSQGWQERLAALQGGKDPLMNGVSVTLSDGRKLSGLKVFDSKTLEMDKELSFDGVVITDMTPMMEPQVDDSPTIHPYIGLEYPNVREQKTADHAADKARKETNQDRPYTDASLDVAISASIEAFTKLILSTTTAPVSVSSSSITPITAPTMQLSDLKQLEAKVQSAEKIEDVREAFANAALFINEITKESERLAKAHKDADANRIAAEATAADIKKQLGEIQAQYQQLKAAQEAAAAEQQFNERMTTVAEVFDLEDDVRAELVEEIKACANDEAFTKWLTKAKKVMKEKTKEHKKAMKKKMDDDEADAAKKKGSDKKGEKPGDKADDEEDDGDEDDAKASKAAAEAIASAKDNVIDPAHDNSLDAKEGSLKDRYTKAFAAGISVGGTRVSEVTKGKK